MDIEIQKIKNVLKDQLKRKKMTYEDLGEELDLSVPTIKRWLGDGDLGLSDLLRICRVLDLELTELHMLADKHTTQKDEVFTEAQQEFLAKNTGYFSYFLKLLDGNTPQQIAEKYQLTALSTNKYLLKLEKHDLIRVTGKQRVKVNFNGVPDLGNGILARTYYRQQIQVSGQFFVSLIEEALRNHANPSLEKKRQNITTTYGLQTVRLSRQSYEKWALENGKAIQELAAISKIEEKSLPQSELFNAVIVNAHSLLPQESRELSMIDDIFGRLQNI